MYGDLVVFAINRSLEEAITIDIDTRAFGAMRVVEATQLSNPDPYLKVTADTADSVAPVANPNTSWSDTTLEVVLPPLSWNVVRLARA